MTNNNTSILMNSGQLKRGRAMVRKRFETNVFLLRN